MKTKLEQFANGFNECLKANLCTLVGIVIVFVTIITMEQIAPIITNKDGLKECVIGIISALTIDLVMLKICEKKIEKIIKKGRKFWFYFLISWGKGLKVEDQIDLVCWSNVSTRHKEMLNQYLKRFTLCEDAKKHLNNNY